MTKERSDQLIQQAIRTQEASERREQALLRAVEKLDRAIMLWQEFDRHGRLRVEARD